MTDTLVPKLWNRWPDCRVLEVTDLWAKGFSASVIAKRMGEGLTRNAVIGKVHRLGLSAREVPSDPAKRVTYPKHRRSAPGPRKSLVAKSVTVSEALPMEEKLATVGRPWPVRVGKPMCAYPVAGKGADMLSCCAPAHALSETSAAYCAAHRAVMFTGAPKPDVRFKHRPGFQSKDTIAPEWDAA